MAFSFNWAGLQVPTVQYSKAVDDPNFGTNLGNAARGYVNRQSAKEFAGKIDNFRKARTADAADKARRVEAIKAEIARLKAENANIEQMLSMPEAPQEQQIEHQSAWMPTDEEYTALMFDPATADKSQIQAMQSAIGVTPDGVWGPASQNAYNAKYGYLTNPGDGNTITFGG